MCSNDGPGAKIAPPLGFLNENIKHQLIVMCMTSGELDNM